MNAYFPTMYGASNILEGTHGIVQMLFGASGIPTKSTSQYLVGSYGTPCIITVQMNAYFPTMYVAITELPNLCMPK